MPSAKTMKRRKSVNRRIEETLDRDYFTDRSTMIRLYPGDEKKYHFPVRANWLYQLAIEIVMKNTPTRITRHFGKSTGRSARGDYCCSKTWDHFNFSPMYDQAITHAYARCAGAESDYDPDSWGDWKPVGEPLAVYVIIYRKLLQRRPGVRHKGKTIKLQEKKLRKKSVKQKVSERKKEMELEKKYPTPKKYIKAQKALKRKIAAQNKKGLKRKRPK